MWSSMISTTLFVSSGLFWLNQILRKMIQSYDMKEGKRGAGRK